MFLTGNWLIWPAGEYSLLLNVIIRLFCKISYENIDNVKLERTILVLLKEKLYLFVKVSFYGVAVIFHPPLIIIDLARSIDVGWPICMH